MFNYLRTAEDTLPLFYLALNISLSHVRLRSTSTSSAYGKMSSGKQSNAPASLPEVAFVDVPTRPQWPDFWPLECAEVDPITAVHKTASEEALRWRVVEKPGRSTPFLAINFALLWKIRRYGPQWQLQRSLRHSLIGL
jgi:hypothetical protein